MKTHSKDGFIPARSRDVLFRKNPDGSIAILRLDSDQYIYSIEGLAAEVWLMIDGKTPLSSIMKTLIEKHSPPEKRFRSDVDKFMKSLSRESLISP